MNCLIQSTYVDDVVSGADFEEEAFNLYVKAKLNFCEGGFNLRKFESNSLSLQAKIDADEGIPDSAIRA